MTPNGFLAGITVLDLSTVGPAARATRLLADYGADVVKVGPVPGKGHEPITPPFFAYSGQRFMSRACIDLRCVAGREAFLALARGADVIVESFRPGVVDRLGIGYSAVAEVNARIVYCSTSGYGQKGPRAGWAGHDIDYLAVGGFLASSAPRADGGPPLPGATVADAAGGGLHAAAAVLAALVARASTGGGAFLDVSAADGVAWLMSLGIDEALATGAEPGPGHDVLSGRYACYESYPTRDGGWVAVGAIEAKFFANLCRLLGCPRWTEHQYDDEVQDQIREDFRAAFLTRDRDDWVADLGPADTCVAPVLRVAEVASDQGLRDRDAFLEVKSPTGGSFRQVAPVLAGMLRPAEPLELPDPGETHTVDLLMKVGYDRSTLDQLLQDGVIA